MKEAELQEAIIETAHLYGWIVAHFRPARTERGWRTPVSADGKGFPDLVLVRERILFVEVKSASGRLSDEQGMWVDWINNADGTAFIWRPRHWLSGEIEQELRR